MPKKPTASPSGRLAEFDVDNGPVTLSKGFQAFYRYPKAALALRRN
jgi:hypothetical protein